MRLRVQGFAYRRHVVCQQGLAHLRRIEGELDDRNPPRIARAAVVASVWIVAVAGSLKKAGRWLFRLGKRNCFATVRTQPVKQPLREKGEQHIGKHIAFHAQPHQPVQRQRRIVGMNGGQHQMAGIGGIDRHFGGFAVAHFADQNHIGVVAHKAADNFGKRAINRMNADLVRAFNRIFHRVFGGADVDVGTVDVVETGVERVRFARSGRTAAQNQPLVHGQNLFQRTVHGIGHMDGIQPEMRVFLIQDTAHRALAVTVGQNADPYVHHCLAGLIQQPERSVLRRLAVAAADAAFGADFFVYRLRSGTAEQPTVG